MHAGVIVLLNKSSRSGEGSRTVYQRTNEVDILDDNVHPRLFGSERQPE